MKATQKLYDMGQSIWLDNLTRGLLNSGTLGRYIQEFSVTGLTSNLANLECAIREGNEYDRAFELLPTPPPGAEEQFTALALEDVKEGADLLRPVFELTDGVDGWVSLELSPLLANDTAGAVAEARRMHEMANRPNVYIKIPGTKAGLPAVEEAIFLGIPVNVTLLYSREQYLAASEAYLRGQLRRLDAGLKPDVSSVASVAIGQWDVATSGRLPAHLRHQLGIAIAGRAYAAYRALIDSPRCQQVIEAGGRTQRLLWTETGIKEPASGDLLYIKALAAPFTVNAMPEAALTALADHGDLGGILSTNGAHGEEVIANVAKAGISVLSLAARLQDEGLKAQIKTWHELMACITEKGAAVI